MVDLYTFEVGAEFFVNCGQFRLYVCGCTVSTNVVNFIHLRVIYTAVVDFFTLIPHL